MDLFRFINSRDIREFLQEQHYVFNSLEAAWLIYQCRTVSLKEKHIAWKELIHTMPDCEMPERINCEYRSSLHGFLKEYMEFQDQYISMLYHTAANAVYRSRTYYEKDHCWTDNDYVFSSYKSCMETLRFWYNDANQYAVQKHLLDAIRASVKATMKTNGTILSIEPGIMSSDVKSFYNSFEGLWFDFPVPFRKGDIIWDPSRPEGLCGGPLVMSGICTIDTPVEEKNSIIENGDTTDMTVRGYFVDAEGQAYEECTSNYMNYEFYTGTLTDAQKFLLSLKSYLQGKTNLPMLLKSYHYYQIENVLENTVTEEHEMQFLTFMESLMSH